MGAAQSLAWQGLRATLVLLVIGTVTLGLPQSLVSQTTDLRREILDSQRRLEEIREERNRLRRQMEEIRTRVQDVSSELRNVEQQLSASRSVLSELDFQLDATSSQVRETTRDLLMTRERLQESRAVLNRRLRDIYKRGPLNSTRVLLGADSFADLLTRYRYLELIAGYDRTLVERVTVLETDLVRQSRQTERSLSELGSLRQEKLEELAELRAVEQNRQRTLAAFRSDERETMSRLDQLQADETRLQDLLSDLEERRREEERRRVISGREGAGPGTLGTADVGVLDWPVDGTVIYQFGRDRRPNGTVLRRNGMGITAAAGTPVQAVRSGLVVLAGPFEGYGPTVVLSHGEGFYTLYLYLEDIGVVEGREVQAGQVVGTVGGSDTPEGPHIEFQIRAPVAGGSPQAMDPLRWLRPRGQDQ